MVMMAMMAENTSFTSFVYLIACILSFGCLVAGQLEVEDIQGSPDPVNEGDNSIFVCTVNNFQTDYILAWSKNGERITRNEMTIVKDLKERSDFALNFDYNMITNGVTTYLHFSSIKRDDSGVYACEVYSSTETLLKSKSIDVHVMYSPSNEYPKCQPNTEIFATIGQSLAFSCLTEEGSPAVHLSWKREHTDSTFVDVEGTSSHGNGFINSEIIIPEVTLAERDSAFVCTLYSSDNNILGTCSVRIQITLPEPLISISPKVGAVELGNSIEFMCYSDLVMTGIFWASEPVGFPADRVSISTNRQVLTVSNTIASDNGTVIFCSFQFQGLWIRTGAILYVGDTSHLTQDLNLSSSQSSVGSPIGWMVAFILLMCTVLIAGLAVFLLKRKIQKNTENRASRPNIYQRGNEAPPYVINRIGEEPSEGQRDGGNSEEQDTMEVGKYAPYHPRNPPRNNNDIQENRHTPLQRVNGANNITSTQNNQSSGGYELPRSGDTSVRNSELENPEYMTQGNFLGARAPNRPIRIRNFSHVSEATTVEPDYMPVEI